MKTGVLGTVALAALLLVAACGGNSAATQPAGTRVQASQPGQAGAPIDVAAIQAGTTALQTQHDSWQYTTTTYESGTPSFTQTIAGNQQTEPQTAYNATLTREGMPDKRYTRIGDDIWYDDGTGSYVQTTASDSAVVSAYEPYSLDGLAQSAEQQGYQYLPVGEEKVGGVTTMHYRLDPATIDSIVKDMQGVTAADWAADVYLAVDDGSLLRLAWGPKTADDAQLTTGFDWMVTSIDCVCPVDPPAASPS